jgi:Rad3-related DNA helicase
MSGWFRFSMAQPEPASDTWYLTTGPNGGSRTLPLGEFLGIFDPTGSLQIEMIPESELPDLLPGKLAELEWGALSPEVWAALFSLLQDPGWQGFVAEGGRLAAERTLASKIKPRVKKVNPYSPDDLERGEDLLREIFSDDGHLARIIGDKYEPRHSQLDMALAVWQSFLGGSDLVIEAPTGVGKSLAYLIPAGLFALMAGQRVILSTNTRNLQDQLIKNDLPTICGSDWFPVDAALLKGRENYLCRRKVDNFLAGIGDSREESLAAAALTVFLATSDHGLIEEVEGNPLLPATLLRDLRARNQDAEQSRCAARKDCLVTCARDRARTGQLVVVNHSLLLADHMVDGGLLGKYSYLVLDEVHNLDEVATRTLGISISRWDLDTMLRGLSPEGGGRRWDRRTLSVWLPQMRRLAEIGPDIDLMTRRDALLTQVLVLRESARELFEQIVELGPIKGELRRSGRLRYRAEQNLPKAVAGGRRSVIEAMEGLITAAREGAESLAKTDIGTGDDGDRTLEVEQLGSLAGNLREFKDRLEFLLAAEDESFVFYMVGGGDRGELRELVASPVDVSAELGAYFSDGLTSAILTSATLSVQGNFEYLLGKIGLERSGRDCHHLNLPSPFNYEEQLRVLLPAWLPDPRVDSHTRNVIAILTDLQQRFRMNTLVLMTSYSSLQQVAQGLLAAGIPEERILQQQPGLSRDLLANRFRRSSGTILIGTSSFWEGVDFPGDSLKILVINQLPFAVPTEPLVEARCEKLKREGVEPFFNYTIPEAVLRFKQGFGRLIRSGRDEGLVLLLDSRLAHKGYGQRFLSSLPARTRIIFDREMFETELHEWYTSRPRQPLD